MIPHGIEDTYTGRDRRALARSLRDARMSLLLKWALSRTAGFRVGLFVGYVVTTYYGVSAIVAGVPSLMAAGSADYSAVWSVIVTAAAAVCSVVSVRETPEGRTPVFERIEFFGALLLFIALSIYSLILLYIAYGGGDSTRVTTGAGFLVIAATNGARAMWLAATVWRREWRHV